MDYKELYNEAVGDLKTNKAKQAYKTLKNLSNYNVGSKILDVEKGPLLGKFNKQTEGKILTTEAEIATEIQAYLKEHYSSSDQ